MRARVLVVDDSQTVRKIIVAVLGDIGITDIVEAEDGDAAMIQFETSRFDLILTNWNMPGKSGLDLIQAIRSKGSTVPIMMVTTESTKPKVQQAIAAGASDYLAKPFDNEVLQQRVLRQLDAAA